MKIERQALWREADELFRQWLELESEARESWQAALRLDAGLQRAFERLIEADQSPQVELQFAISEAAVTALSSAPSQLPEPVNRLAGRRIGEWQLIEEIGRGGMSVVYRAKLLDADYEQQAAVKLLSLAMIGTGGEARFAQERRVLASLDHPHIARLIGGGIAEDGTPYLVMHLVEGTMIDVYCRERGLGLRQRLDLMLPVCDAVAFAHRNLVVHRDLKPGNILVDGSGVPVLLDFGIAKLLQPDDEHTGTVMRALTPGFAAPEQMSGGRITTATDVYGLGAVLARLSSDGAPLPRDLVNIIAKTQREEPERRYPDARALAADLRRLQAMQPVHASPDSTWYRLAVLLRRRRALMLSIGIAALLLVGGVLATLWQAQNARAQAARAEATRDFLVDLLAAGNIEASGGEDPRVSDLIAAGSARIGSAFAEAPALRAELAMMLGQIQIMHGDHAQAAELLDSALQWAEHNPGDGRLLRLTLLHLGTLANRRGEPQQAVDRFERAWQMRIGSSPADQQFRAGLLLGLAYAMDNLGQGEAMHQRIIEQLAEPGAYRDPAAQVDALTALSMLERDPQDKLQLMLRIESVQSTLDASPVTHMTRHAQLAAAYGAVGDRAQATSYASRAAQLADQIYPPQHVSRARIYSNLGSALASAGRRTEALVALNEAERIYRALGDNASPSFAALLNNRGTLLRDIGDAQQSEVALLESAALARNLFGDADRRSASVLVNLIATRAELGAHPELDTDVGACLAIAEGMQSARVEAMCLRAGAQAALAQGRPELALERLNSSVALAAHGSVAPALIRARLALTQGRALLALGRLEDARHTLREGLAACEEDAEALQILAWQLHATSADLAATLGRGDDALHHQREALRILDAMGVGDSAAAQALRAELTSPELE